jgi:hypothetical protein
MISNRTQQTIGSINAGSNQLNLSTQIPLYKGDIVSILDAGGVNDSAALAHTSQVVEVFGNLVILSEPAMTSAFNVNVYSGHSNVSIIGSGTLNGDYDGVTNNGHAPIRFWWSNKPTVKGLTVRNASHAGVFFSRGVRNGLMEDLIISDIGNNGVGGYIGSAIWLFDAVRSSTVRRVTVTDSTYAVVIDDRSVSADQFNGPCLDNLIDGILATGCNGGGIIVHGSNNNTVNNVDVTGGLVGIEVYKSKQGAEVSQRQSINNIVKNSIMRSCDVGLKIGGIGTKLENLSFVNCAIDIVNDE